MPRRLYKILTAEEWAGLGAAPSFAGSVADRRDGFIHLSKADQLRETLARHFPAADRVILLAVDAAALPTEALRCEPARGGEDFPHLYAPLEMTAVRAIYTLRREDGGGFALPAEIAGG